MNSLSPTHFARTSASAFLTLVFVVLQANLSTASIVKIMSIGDSITGGFHGSPSGSYRQELQPMLAAQGIEFDFVGEFERGPGDNEFQGYSGAGIGTIALEVGPALVNYEPDIALVLAGTNNHFGNLTQADFVVAYQNLIDVIRTNSDAKIIFATVPKFGYAVNRPADDRPYWTRAFVDNRNAVTFPRMNSALMQIAANDPSIKVVDYYSQFDEVDDVSGDGVHPNLFGQQKIANAFYPELLSAARVVSIPEPSVACLLLAGAGVWAVLSSRRRPLHRR